MLGIFLDQETTGLDSNKHSVIELAFVALDLNTGEEKASYSSVVKLSKSAWDERDPVSILINGFTFEEVRRGKDIEKINTEVVSLLTSLNFKRGNSVFICQNPSFDRSFFTTIVDTYSQERLFWPYHWLDLASMFWVLEVHKAKETRSCVPDETHLSKDSIASSLKMLPETKPHRAMQGVRHLIACYAHMLGFPRM